MREPDLRSKGVRWLDFFQDLLTPNGEELKQEFQLDGTHLHPR
jgi:hypothetical protein